MSGRNTSAFRKILEPYKGGLIRVQPYAMAWMDNFTQDSGSKHTCLESNNQQHKRREAKCALMSQLPRLDTVLPTVSSQSSMKIFKLPQI